MNADDNQAVMKILGMLTPLALCQNFSESVESKQSKERGLHFITS